MPPKVKFEFDQPQTLVFMQDRGKAVESRFPGEAQFFRNVEGLKSAYLPASLERMLLQMNYRAGESVIITKRKTAAGATYWEADFVVDRSQPNRAPEHREPTAPVPRTQPIAFPPNKYFHGEPPALQFPEVAELAPAKPPKSVNHANEPGLTDPATMHQGMARILQSCLCAAIDAGREAQAYAGDHGFPLTFGPGEIQAMAVSLYIHQSKQANINLMHRNETLRTNGTVRVNGHAPSQHA